MPSASPLPTVEIVREFVAFYDGHDSSDQLIRARLRIRREQYRRERDYYAEWVDHGGEGGEA